MGKLYRTAQGKQIDIEAIRLKNELVPALGNMKVNARGDQLGSGGAIVKTREQIVDEIYRSKLDNTTQPAKEGPIPRRSVKSDPIPTSSKKAAAEFTPAPMLADEAPAEKPKRKKSEGGLAKAVAKAKGDEQ